MKKIIHIALLIAGTSIGVGIVALPMVAVNLGLPLVTGLVALMLFIGYRSFMMPVDVNIRHQSFLSIVEMSREHAGRVTFFITLSSYCLLLFGLLTAYFSCLADTIGTFCNVPSRTVIMLCGIGLLALVNLRNNIFSKINSVCVSILLLFIGIAIVHVCGNLSGISSKTETHLQLTELSVFLPTIFTSFGMQVLCSYVCSYLDNDRKKISKAAILGVIIPAVIYTLWIFCVLKNVATHDIEFYRRLQAHQVSVGELIQFLCTSSHHPALGVFLKVLTLFAVITSTIGIAVGLLQPLQSFLPKNISKIVLCFIPVLINLTVRDAFMKVLSFGGMMLAIFAIFVPYYLLWKEKKHRASDCICLAFGVAIVLCELKRFF